MTEFITTDLLDSLGVELNAHESHAMDEHFKSTLRRRVLDEAIDSLDENQIIELSHIAKSGGDLWPWIKANTPDIDEIIDQETDILLGELAENSDKF